MTDASGPTRPEGLPCPGCGYDLRGTAPDPISDHLCCPECGRTSTREELRRAAEPVLPRLLRRFVAMFWPSMVVGVFLLLMMVGNLADYSSPLYWPLTQLVVVTILIGGPLGVGFAIWGELPSTLPRQDRLGRMLAMLFLMVFINIAIMVALFVLATAATVGLFLLMG